jgi:hypothetical protein
VGVVRQSLIIIIMMNKKDKEFLSTKLIKMFAFAINFNTFVFIVGSVLLLIYRNWVDHSFKLSASQEIAYTMSAIAAVFSIEVTNRITTRENSTDASPLQKKKVSGNEDDGDESVKSNMKKTTTPPDESGVENISVDDRLRHTNVQLTAQLIDAVLKYDELNTQLTEAGHDTTALTPVIEMALKATVLLMATTNDIIGVQKNDDLIDS